MYQTAASVQRAWSFFGDVMTGAAIGGAAAQLAAQGLANTFNYFENDRQQGRNISSMDHAHRLNRAMFDHQMSAQKAYDQEKYVRMTSGMRAAGLNPALAAGGGTTASAAASGGSAGGAAGGHGAVPGSFDLMGALTAKEQWKLMKQQTRKADAEAGREEIREQLERKAAATATKGWSLTGKGISNFLDDVSEKAGRALSAENNFKPNKNPKPKSVDTDDYKLW